MKKTKYDYEQMMHELGMINSELLDLWCDCPDDNRTINKAMNSISFMLGLIEEELDKYFQESED